MEKIFRISDDTVLTDEKLLDYIHRNDMIVTQHYLPLWKAYNNKYKIFELPKKPRWKPDNRIAVNFAEYIVNTFEGFFMGTPVKIESSDEAVREYITANDDANDADDINAEVSTICSIFGRGYRIAFVDEDGEIGSAFLDPMESFAIYNESIKPKMRYFIRTYVDSNKMRRGSISDDTTVRYFHLQGGLQWDGEPILHGFGSVPAVEFVQNRARKGVFESVLPLIDSYNKALSEKANDVDYFADAYLRVLGAKVDKETIRFMRENRTINIPGSKGENVVVDFLQKPSSDGTQENLLNRIERMIFTIAMVCNISDENFATSSGIALKYKLEPMNNLASKKWRKFQTGLKEYYKLMCSNPVTPLKPDDWSKLKFSHTLNYPANNLDEAQTAQTLQGIVSKKTQLKTLSCVDNVYEEMEEIIKEQEAKDAYYTAYATNRVMNDEESGSNTGTGISGTAIDRADSPKAIEKSIRNRSR